ncbi:MAG: PIN domain-containing protein [Thermoflexibacter sp.]|jgi:predicted nucleic acid-binding protein|nr:PIN domain-containing protein [Thermoflexibacter sp.]
MIYLLDTNILLLYLREKDRASFIDLHYQPLQEPHIPLISVVSVGEIKSIALQNNWGESKRKNLTQFLKQFIITDIKVETIIERYAEIDAFSQGKLNNMPLNDSARNMAKNDLWIAATASVLKATLLTTDKDFNHLHNKFLELAYIDIYSLK